MQRQLLTTVLILISVCAYSQTSHYLGGNLGLMGNGNTSAIAEYEVSFYNTRTGYERGFVTGIAFSKPFDKPAYDREYSIHTKIGMKFYNVHFGLSAGVKKGNMEPRDYWDTMYNGPELSLHAGLWANMNVSKGVKIQVGGDNFNGFIAGFLFKL